MRDWACKTHALHPHEDTFVPGERNAWYVAHAPAAMASMRASHVRSSSQAILESWQQDQPPAHPWTITHLLATQQSAGRRVGLIMDLSNHDTLYAEDIQPSLEYKHIQLVAKVCAAVVGGLARCKQQRDCWCAPRHVQGTKVLTAAWRRCCHPKRPLMKSSGRRRPSGRHTRTSTLPSTVHMVRHPGWNIAVHIAVTCCCTICPCKFMHKASAMLQLVRCCAGFNRTGFIMCSYLCEAEGMTVDDALDSFAAVRPPGVKHGETWPCAQWCSAA